MKPNKKMFTIINFTKRIFLIFFNYKNKVLSMNKFWEKKIQEFIKKKAKLSLTLFFSEPNVTYDLLYMYVCVYVF